MSDLIALPPKPASPPASGLAVDAVGSADAFWPEMDFNDVRARLRLGDGLTTHERLTAAIEGAIIAVVDDLGDWATRQQLAGATRLDQVDPTARLDGTTFTEILFQRAVRYLAAAELADGHADLTATSEGTDRAQDKRVIADDYRRLAITAIRGLLRRGVQDAANPAPRGGAMVDLI